MTFAFRNLATWDRVLRILLGASLLAVGVLDLLPDLGRIAMVLFGWVPLVTGALGWCPIYSLLRFSTIKRPPKQP